MKLFSRQCTIEYSEGDTGLFEISFFSPEKSPDNDEYISKVTFSCSHFQSEAHGIGSDAAQAFFVLSSVATSYLIGLRRYGYEVYWHEKGDLDCADFWTYRQ